MNKTKFDKAIETLPEERRELAQTILVELIEIDNKLDNLRKKDFIKSNKNHPEIKKKTVEYEIYKDLLNQKNNFSKTLFSLFWKSGVGDTDDEDPMKDFKETLAAQQ